MTDTKADVITRVSIGVDPGNTSGWAVILGRGAAPGKLYSAGTVTTGSAKAMHRVIYHLGKEITAEERAANHGSFLTVDGLDANAVRRLAVEEQWVPRAGGASSGDSAARKSYAQATAALGVAASRGKWMAVAELLGFESVTLHPSTWRTSMMGRQWANKPRAQCKAQALVIVQAAFGVRLPKCHDHVAESILLASYMDAELRVEETMRKSVKW